MISLADLDPATRHGSPTDAMEPGSTLARTLFHAWRGDPVVIVQSPPGAGKTSLVSRLAATLAQEGQFTVTVACPTVQASASVARRIGALAPRQVALVGSAFRHPVDDVLVDTIEDVPDTVRVRVRTVASARMAPPAADIMIFDEAYQVTFSDVAAAADNARQVVLVGDPGQIGPPTTIDVAFWERHKVAPHHRSPEGFTAAFTDSTVLHLPTSYRLGQDTVEAISPLYPFPFTSSRPTTSVEGVAEVETLYVPVSDRVADLAVLRRVADRARALVGTPLATPGGPVPLGGQDLAVIAARNEQTTALSGLLTAQGLGDVTVGTADRLQGAQYAAVVALDPFFGAPTGSAHSRSLGRLCVMASRHFAHLTWVTSPDWRDVIAATDMDKAETRAHLRVRAALAGTLAAGSLAGPQR